MTVEARTRTAVWWRVSSAALAGMALVHLVSTIALENDYPPLALAIEVPLLILAGLVASHRRWAAVTGAILASLMVVFTAAGLASRMDDLDAGEYLAGGLFMVLGLVAAAAGVVAATSSSGGRRPPP